MNPSDFESVKEIEFDPADFEAALTDNGKGRLRSAGSTVARGVSEAMADAGKALARLASNPNLGVAPGSMGYAPARQRVEAEADRYAKLSPVERQAKIEADPIFQAADQFAAAGRENYQPNPAFQGEWLADKIPSAAASTIVPLAAGLVAGPGAAAMTYGAQSGQQGAQEAIDAGHVEDADKVFMGYALAGGVSERFLGLGGNIWRYVREARKAGMNPNRFAEWTRQIGKAGGREALQEGGEQVIQNTVFGEVTGEDRPLLQGVGESMALGAIVGGGIHAAITGPIVATQRQPQSAPPVEPAPTTDAAPTAPAIELPNLAAGKRFMVWDLDGKEMVLGPLGEDADIEAARANQERAWPGATFKGVVEMAGDQTAETPAAPAPAAEEPVQEQQNPQDFEPVSADEQAEIAQEQIGQQEDNDAPKPDDARREIFDFLEQEYPSNGLGVKLHWHEHLLDSAAEEVGLKSFKKAKSIEEIGAVNRALRQAVAERKRPRIVPNQWSHVFHVVDGDSKSLDNDRVEPFQSTQEAEEWAKANGMPDVFVTEAAQTREARMAQPSAESAPEVQPQEVLTPEGVASVPLVKLTEPADAPTVSEEPANERPDRVEPGKPEPARGVGGVSGPEVAGSPEVDVRQSAGASPEPAPARQAGVVGGREEPGGVGAGVAVARPGDAQGSGVRDSAGDDNGTSGRAGDVGEPAAADPEQRAPEDQSGSPGGLTPAPEEHVLPADADWIPKGDRARVKANLDAVKLLKVLESEDRLPTAAEREVLARYVGWGGLKEAFDRGKAAYRGRDRFYSDEQEKEYRNWEKSWGKLFDEVQQILTPEEYARASASILNAHYTSRTVINGVWEAVRRLGFRGGVVLETSAGIGHFIGLQPQDMRDQSRWRAVELDSISGRILSKLYPRARLTIGGFETAPIRANSVDLIVGNVPFAKDGPSDPRYPNLSLHNYFFARGIDLLAPGGLMVAISSDSTLDGQSSRKSRELFAEKADFVGSIRLPNTAFKDNAGTEVTTDILVFRKRDGSPFTGVPFIRTAQTETHDGKPIEINEYYVANPHMLLGRLSLEGTMYRGDMPALIPEKGADLAAQLAGAVARLPEGAFGAQVTPDRKQSEEELVTVSGKVGGLVVKDGKPYLVGDAKELVEPEWAKTPAKRQRAVAYVGVRDAAKELIALQLNPDVTDDQIAAARARLNAVYDKFVAKHGRVNAKANEFLDEDVEFPLVSALEDDVTSIVRVVKSGVEAAKRVTDWVKSKLFTERTIFPRLAPVRAESVEDGYHISMNYRGRVDPSYISELTGIPQAEVVAWLVARGVAFVNPESGQVEPRWMYLAGNVKRKLRRAREAASSDPAFQPNVAALEKVQPAPLAIENISVRLGATWVAPEIIERFLEEKLEVGASVSFTPQTGNWHVAVRSGWGGAKNTTTYGIHNFAGHELVALALNLRNPEVKRAETRIGQDGRPYEAEVKDGPKSVEAQEKQRKINSLFQEWVRQTPAVASRLEAIYNEQFNGMVSPSFDPPTWERYPGASQDVVLRPHQKRVVTRMLTNSTLLAHSVGTGKTYSMITAAMEQRRMGLAKKPMIVVQNATLEQFARSFKKLYPTARVLAPNARQRDAKNRNRTMARIATGDWDCVIVPQSFINMLPDDPAREAAYIADQIKQLEEAIVEAAAKDGKKSPKVADLERARKRLEERLGELANRKKDDVITFEQLGVDSMFVDEAHAYKKLQFVTKKDNIKGLDKGASQRGFSMMMKVRWVQEKNQGRNVVFATGTPVSNTIAEAWTMMRYLRPDMLKELGIEQFDSFLGVFADEVVQWEMTAGGAFKQVTRLAKYVNGPELIAAWRTVADVVTAEEANLPGLPALKNGKTTSVVIPRSDELARYVAHLRSELDRFAAMSGREKRDNSHIPLVVFGKAKKATLDMRMIDPGLPDQPGSKLNVAADRIMGIYRDSAPVLGTQMVFSDAYQNNPDNPQFNLYNELKAKLVARGIPEGEIVIITDTIKDAKREDVFRRFNEGEIRVVIGSTERMGVGVNAQRKMVALHHLDAPPRPMDVEQRNGRIVRQQNENPVVEILAYGVENTLDAAMYQKLATKQKFINQLLRGQIDGRNFEDPADEVSLSHDEMMAAFSGNPLVLEKVALESTVRQLEGLRAGHYEQVRKSRMDLDDLTTRRLPAAEGVNAKARSTAEVVRSALGGGVTFAQIGGAVQSERKEIAAALDKLFPPLLDAAREDAKRVLKAGGNGTFGTSGPVTWVVNGLEVRAHAEARIAVTGTIEAPVMRWAFVVGGESHACTTGQGFLQGVPSEVANLTQHAPANAAATVAMLKRNQAELTGFVLTQFDRESELESARRRLAQVESELQTVPGVAVVGPTQPLLLEVGRTAKPLEAQRQQIRRLLDQMEARQAGFEEWSDIPALQRPEPEPLSGHVEWMDRLKKRLGEIERLMIRALEDLKVDMRGSLHAFGVVPAVWNASVDVVKIAIRGGASLAEAVAKGLAYIQSRQRRKAWDRVAVQNAFESIAVGAAAGASPEAETQITLIEGRAPSVNARPKPLVDPSAAPRRFESMRQSSSRIAYWGGADLLRSKQELDLTAAYQAAAVKEQAEHLADQLFAAARTAHTGWGLPKWMRVGAWASRVREFKKRALHVAARLNATGRNPDGSWRFDDFAMRAGMMTTRAFLAGKHAVGDVILRQDPETGTAEEFRVGPLVTTAEGRVGYQLYREMKGAVQADIYRWYAEQYPELIWFLDMFIDPALAGVRQTINGVQIPVFNRFAQAAAMADADPNFTPITGYTPDVLVSRSLMGALRGALSFRAGTKSPGRRYKFGTSRESGSVRDLLTGFNVRTFQMLQEQARKDWRAAVLRAATGIPQTGVPEGWLKLETGMEELWQAVRRLRRWSSPLDPVTGHPLYPETEARMSDDGSAEWKKFFGEAAGLRGRQLMLPKSLVEVLVRQHASRVQHGALFRLGAWAVRNSTQLFLVHPITYVANAGTNVLFELEAATRYAMSGLMKANGQDLRFARALFSGMWSNRFLGLRRATGIAADGGFAAATRDVLPDQVFADSTSLADVKVRWGESIGELLARGEIGGAALQAIKYGNIDLRSKQRVAYAFLKAAAITEAKQRGLKRDKLSAAVKAYMANPPAADRVRAVESANFEILNYSETPEALARFAENDYSRLILPFPRFGYHYLAKQGRRLAAVRKLVDGSPAGQKADALADLVTVGLFGLGGMGLLVSAVVQALMGDDRDAREFVGTSTVPEIGPDGGVTYRPIDRSLVTANRVNLSFWARAAGIETGGDDFWWRVRNYPVIAMAGAVAIALNDARKYGPAAGAKAYLGSVSDLAGDFFSVGAGVRIPAKVWAEIQSAGSSRPTPSVVDPYAAYVPLSFYVTEQLVDSLVPGSRQADELVAFMDPVERRRTPAKTIGYHPGPIEALRVGHWSGLVDRLASGGESALPAAGPVDRRTGDIEARVSPASQRLGRLLGVNVKPVDRERYERELTAANSP
jgi:N12 class adenine-specific DNA methylase